MLEDARVEEVTPSRINRLCTVLSLYSSPSPAKPGLSTENAAPSLLLKFLAVQFKWNASDM